MAEDNELGRFLRSRREQLDPRALGLPDSGRRRTPGLRREEVATLAGVSMDYLVRLEQGRDRTPSAQVVDSLGRALQLDRDERRHLSKLAACAATPELCPTGDGDAGIVPDTVHRLLERLHPTPAVLLGPWYQVLAYNGAWERVMGPVGVLDDEAPNLARFLFSDPRARSTFPGWDAAADEQVAVLREASIIWRNDARIHALIDELTAIPEFSQRWNEHDVVRRRRGTKVIVHPTAGDLRIDYEVLLLADDSDQRLITWLPADEATAEALDRLIVGSEQDRRAGLRIVGG